jgi:O-antigen ligase
VLDTFATSSAFTSASAAGRSVGTVGHPIVYGTFCMVTMCAALGLRGRLWGVPFAAGAVGLVLSGSRSAWIGMAVALVVWWVAHRRRITRRHLYLLAGLAAGVGAAAAIGPRPVRSVLGFVADRLSNLTGSASATARYHRTAAAMSGIRESAATFLLGRGPQAHVEFFQQVGIDDGLAQTFDNSYLTLWYDFGLLALLVFVAVLAVLLIRARSTTARMLVAGFAAQIWFFDFYVWPSAAATLLLATALGVGRYDGRAQLRSASTG